MMIQGKQQIVRGGVLFALADTLAAHSIGGFKVRVGFALRKCRMCLATKEQLSTKVTTHHNCKACKRSVVDSIANCNYEMHTLFNFLTISNNSLKQAASLQEHHTPTIITALYLMVH